LIGFGANGDRYENWLTNPTTIIDSLLPTEIRTELAAKGYAVEPPDRKEKTNGFFIRGQAVGHTQAVHTAADIPVSAFSPTRAIHSQFVAVQRNTDVFFKIARALLGGY
jgi:alkaline phosphatase